jgi:6-phosphogluconate dehydrogenase
MSTATHPARPTADAAVLGLAVMGRNLARNLARNGFRVAVHNRSAAKTQALVEQFGHEGTFVPADDLTTLVASLERPRRIVVMVQAGPGTDQVIDDLVPLLEPGDVILDAGNAHFADTRRREAKLKQVGIHHLGVGVSGGEEGALLGPSIMPGGDRDAYKLVEDMLTAIAATASNEPCCAYIGPDGAGHFVKMLHNGIEYADMQLIAESYDLLRHGAGLTPQAIGETFGGWNTGDLESYLVEITERVLRQIDAATGKPFVDVVVDQAGQKGTGRWTVQAALDLGVPVSGMAEAVFARSLSGDTLRRNAVQAANLAGPGGGLSDDQRRQLVNDVNDALYASKLVAYAQGFDALAAASAEYDWDLDLGQIARLWRGGCIIRARFLDRISDAYARDPHVPTLLVDEHFSRAMTSSQNGWRRVIAAGATAGIPTPGFSSALAYYDSLRASRLPAALIQGQRDLFGAHTYQRVDRDGMFHVNWSGDLSEARLGG